MTAGREQERVRPAADEPPPFLGKWGRIYAVIIGYLALLITLFYLFTRYFSA